MYQEFVISSNDVMQRCGHYIADMATRLQAAGKRVRVLVTEDESMATDWHRRKLHGVLQRIAANAWVTDRETGELRQYELRVWKEFFRERFLGTEMVEMPDGTEREWRRSTELLTAAEKNELILQIELYASEELGLDMTYEPKR